MRRLWWLEWLRLMVAGVIGGIFGSILFDAGSVGVLAGCGVYGLFMIEQGLKLSRRWQKLESEMTGSLMFNEPWLSLDEILRLKYNHQQRRLHIMRAVMQEVSAARRVFPEGLLLLSRDGRILWFNRAAFHLLGLRYPQDCGMLLNHFIRDDTFDTCFSAGTGTMEMSVSRGEAEKVQLQFVRLPSYRCLIVARDLTILTRLESTRKDFVANASHELRTPLTVIAGYLDAFLEDDDPGLETWRRPMMEMQRQAQRMQHLMEDLLLLASMESEHGSVRQDHVPMAPIIEDICRDISMCAAEKITIEMDLDRRWGLAGSEVELRSICANLISNAVKYTLAEGHVHIKWQERAGYGLLEVQDTGIGIEDHHVARLTERFYRVDRARSRDKGGTGLGLAIVKHALQRHDSMLEIESTPNVGSMFRCTFPPSRLVSLDKL